MHAGSGAHLQSVATPLALLPLGEGMIFGRVLEGDALHGKYRQHLARALDGKSVRFPQPRTRR